MFPSQLNYLNFKSTLTKLKKFYSDFLLVSKKLCVDEIDKDFIQKSNFFFNKYYNKLYI